MESLASSPEFVYGNFDLILDEENEIAPEGVQQILEVLNTDMEGFNDIINSVFEENNPSDTTTSCDPNEDNELKKENIDQEPDTKEPPAVKANITRFKKLTDGELDDIEANQYSAATRQNTQWRVCVFNRTYPLICSVKTDCIVLVHTFFSKYISMQRICNCINKIMFCNKKNRMDPVKCILPNP